MPEINDHTLENKHSKFINIFVNTLFNLDSLDLTSPPTRYFIRIMSKFAE